MKAKLVRLVRTVGNIGLTKSKSNRSAHKSFEIISFLPRHVLIKIRIELPPFGLIAL